MKILNEQIEVPNEDLQIISWKNAKGSGTMKVQTMYLHNGGVHPDRFEHVLPRPEVDNSGNDLPVLPIPKGFHPHVVESTIYNGQCNYRRVFQDKPSQTILT